MIKYNKFGAIIPQHITMAYKNFGREIQFSEYFSMLFLLGIDKLKEHRNETIEQIKTVFEGQDPNPISYLIESGKIDALFDSKTYEIFYGQMIFARTVDNIQTYLKEVLEEVVRKKPNILKSKETERLDFILDFNNIDQLRKAITDKKIQQLFYAGIDKIELYFRERLGVEIFESTEEKHDFSQAIKSRNLIVHNRGLVTNEFLKETALEGLKIGEMIHMSYQNLSRLNVAVNNFAVRLDEKLIEKFQLDIYENV